MEDLTYLSLRQQEERGCAEDATCPEAREAHERLAELYENRILAGETAPPARSRQAAEHVRASLRAVERSLELLALPLWKLRD